MIKLCPIVGFLWARSFNEMLAVDLKEWSHNKNICFLHRIDHASRYYAWYEEGSETPSFKSCLPSNLRSPSNSGLQDPLPFSLSITVCQRFEPPSTDNCTLWPESLFYILTNPPRLFWQYYPNEIQNKNKNKLIWGSYSFIFRGLKSNSKCFFMVNTRLRFNLK